MCSFTEKVQDTGVLEIHNLFLFDGCCLGQTAVELAMKLGLGFFLSIAHLSSSWALWKYIHISMTVYLFKSFWIIFHWLHVSGFICVFCIPLIYLFHIFMYCATVLKHIHCILTAFQDASFSGFSHGIKNLNEFFCFMGIISW